MCAFFKVLTCYTYTFTFFFLQTCIHTYMHRHTQTGTKLRKKDVHTTWQAYVHIIICKQVSFIIVHMRGICWLSMIVLHIKAGSRGSISHMLCCFTSIFVPSSYGISEKFIGKEQLLGLSHNYEMPLLDTNSDLFI